MTRWKFTSSAQGWRVGGVGEFAFTSGLGSPAPGCLSGDGNIDTNITGLSLSVTAGEAWSFRCRFVGNGGFSPPQDVSVEFNYSTGFSTVELYNDVVYTFVSDTSDSGWMTISGTLPYTTTITELQVIFYNLSEATGYLDTIIVAETGLDYDLTHNTGGIPGSII